jgi:hypothetical protein
MTTNFPELKTSSDNPTLVRKILEAVAFIAPEDAPEITALTDASGALQTLDEAYLPVGLVTPDGYTFGGDTTTEDVEALGYTAPVRTDITGQTRTVAFTALETYKKALLELAYGLDLSGVTQSAGGEITFDHPDRPLQRFYRFLVIGRDGSGSGEWFRGKWFPEEVWSSGDPTQYPITVSTYVDDVIGTGERDFIAGAGALAAATQLGFAQAGGA